MSLFSKLVTEIVYLAEQYYHFDVRVVLVTKYMAGKCRTGIPVVRIKKRLYIIWKLHLNGLVSDTEIVFLNAINI